MAQLQDIIAKRKELMGTNSNLSYNDAMAQARQQVAGTTPTVTPVQPTPAPVTPVTTQPTPVTPVAITPPVQAQPVQPTTTQPQDNWMGDFSGIQKKTTTPTSPVTPTNTVTPVTPNPVTPVTTPEPVKAPVKPTEAPIDYNQGLGREQDIAKNLQTFKDQGMTADAIKNASGYNTASPEKKAQIDGFLNAMTTPVVMDQKDIVKSLIAGVNVPKQSTRAYNNAVVMADEFKRFNGMTDIQLLDNLKQGQIGSEMSSLLSQNPNFAKAKEQYKKIQQTNSINRATNYAMNAISGKETPVTDDLAKIESKYSVPLGADEKAYTDYVTNNPEVVASAIQVKQLTKQIADVTATYTQALKDLKSQYPDMPASALLTLMGSRTGETKSLLDSLDTAKTTAKGDFDLAMKMAEGHYNAASKDIANQQLLSNKEKSMQMEADFAKKQAEAALADPATQIKATLEEFSKLGVTATGSLPGKVQEAKDWIAKGGTLDGYINQMRKDLMEKPEYIAQALKKANEGVSFQTIGDKVYKVKDGQLIDTGISADKTEKGTFVKGENGNWINTTTKEIINENDLISSQTNDKLNTYLSNTPVGSKGGQCGSYANKNPVAVANGFKFGDSYQSKLDQTNSKEGAIGAFAVWNPGGVTKQYGHVGQVVGESQDGKSWLIRDSNFSNNPNDETVREHYVPKSVISSTGGAYAVPGIGTKSNTDFSSGDIALFNSSKYNPQTDKDKARAARYEQYQNKNAEIMSDPNASIIDKMKYSKGSKDLTESPNKAYKDMGLVVGQLGRLNQSIKDYDKKSWFGSQLNPIQGIISNANPWDTKAQGVKTQLIQLVPKIARGVFGEVGVLTEADVANYIQTLPNIKQTADVQDVVQLALLSTLKESLDNSLIVDSATYDTSGLIGNYKKLDDKISELQSKVSGTPKSSVSSKGDLMTTLASIGSSLQNALSGIKK